jgi:hypothetical protein
MNETFSIWSKEEGLIFGRDRSGNDWYERVILPEKLENDRLLTIREAAYHLQISRQIIKSIIGDGKLLLELTRRRSGTVERRIRLSALNCWIKQNTVRSLLKRPWGYWGQGGPPCINLDDNLVFTVRDVARLSALSLSTVGEAMRKRELGNIRLRERAFRIPAWELREWWLNKWVGPVIPHAWTGPIEPDRLLNLSEAASRCSCDPRLLRSAFRARQLAFVDFGSHARRVLLSELERWWRTNPSVASIREQWLSDRQRKRERERVLLEKYSSVQKPDLSKLGITVTRAWSGTRNRLTEKH